MAQIETPVLEATSLFSRTLGQSSDVVTKVKNKLQTLAAVCVSILLVNITCVSFAGDVHLSQSQDTNDDAPGGNSRRCTCPHFSQHGGARRSAALLRWSHVQVSPWMGAMLTSTRVLICNPQA